MTNTTTIKRPSLGSYISEHFRLWRDLGKSYVFYTYYRDQYVGDGHPVLVIPGFMGSDASTSRLRQFIAKIGYQPYAWGLGRNYAHLTDLEILSKKIEELYEKHGEAVSLIGWSLGGVYARELAKVKKDKVRQVITLGSPFGGINEPNNASWMYRIIHKGETVNDLDQNWIADLPNPAPVPTTALYSKEDGIVPWEVCLEKVEDATHQNVEVRASHLGMAFDPAVWHIIADRLQYSKDNWKHYTSKKK